MMKFCASWGCVNATGDNNEKRRPARRPTAAVRRGGVPSARAYSAQSTGARASK